MSQTHRQRAQAVVGAICVLAALALTPCAQAVNLPDDCAQRIIRDWSHGEPIVDLYPPTCYQAALRSLPEDVLHYSNADEQIRHALALARHARPAETNAPRKEATATTHRQPGTAIAAAPKAATPLIASTNSPEAALPNPILALATLGLALLGVAAAAWIARRTRPGRI